MQPVLKSKERRREIVEEALRGVNYRYDGADLILTAKDIQPQMEIQNVQLQFTLHGKVVLDDVQDPLVQQMLAVLMAPDANTAQFGSVYATNRGAVETRTGTELWFANHQSLQVIGTKSGNNTVLVVDPVRIMVLKEGPVLKFLKERGLMGVRPSRLEDELK
jgi:hypothetical protein